MRDYLRVFLGELTEIRDVQGTPYAIVQLGDDAYAKTALGVTTGRNSWTLNDACMFEFNELSKLSIVICDSVGDVAVASGSKSIQDILDPAHPKARKVRFSMRSVGQDQQGSCVVELRLERYHFDSFPDRLEVQVNYAAGLPDCHHPRVRITVDNENVTSAEPVPHSGEHGNVVWNQQLHLAYAGHPQMHYEVFDDETGRTICGGSYFLWELLTKDKFQSRGANPLMLPEHDSDLMRPVGSLHLTMKLWDSKEITARMSDHEERLRQLRERRMMTRTVYDKVAPLVKDQERKSAAEFDRCHDKADNHLRTAQNHVAEMHQPAQSQGQMHACKKAVKEQLRQASHDLDLCERALQLMTYDAARNELTIVREARAELDVIARDLEYAKRPMPGFEDEDEELARLQVERLEPLLLQADQAENDFDKALKGIKATSKAYEMNREYDDAVVAKRRMLDLVNQGRAIADIVHAKMAERHRQARQAARNQMLGTAMAGGNAQYPKAITVPALCCCWL